MTCSAFMLIELDEYKDYQLSSMTSNPLMNHDVCNDLVNFEMTWFDLESLQESRPVQWLGQPPPSHIHSCSSPSASNTARNPLWSSCKPFKDFVSRCLGHGGVRNLPFQKIVSSVNASSTLRIKPELYEIVWASFMIWTNELLLLLLIFKALWKVKVYL